MAFTLAEVLITLGIIGVVAAMTIPSLINQYNIHITETRLKKFYSTFNQAVKLSSIDNGDPEGWDEYWQSTYRSDEFYEAVNKYITSYMKVSHIKKYLGATLYVFQDGSAFGYPSNGRSDLYFYPKNPEKCFSTQSTRQNGVCAFLFAFVPNSTSDKWRHNANKWLEPYMFDWDGNISSLYTGKTWSCDGSNGAYCTEIIRLNGWKVPKDYPKKIKY